ncbi:MAG: cell division protein FtsZ [Candidatus Hydrothermarchaeaceae archaeon]
MEWLNSENENANDPLHENANDLLHSDGFGEAKIVVIGSGGGGNNTIDRLAKMGVRGAQLIAVNTDKQHLAARQAGKKVLIGYEITKGLGAGGYPEIGEQSAVEAKPALKDMLMGSDLVFLTCGLGGGTGSGSIPVIAEIAKSVGAVVVGAVTMPFKIERSRIEKAKVALDQLRKHADSVIVIDNNKLLSYVPDVPMNEAFTVADEVMARMVKGITETIAASSLINLDFADVRTVMSQGQGKGIAMIGLGESDTRNRAEEAVQHALENPLLDVDYRGATGALVHIIGGEDLTLAEANHIGEIATSYLRDDANVIWGARISPEYNGKVEVMVIMTGVHSPDIVGPSDDITIPQRDIRRKFMAQPRANRYPFKLPQHSPDSKPEKAPSGVIANLGIDYIL